MSKRWRLGNFRSKHGVALLAGSAPSFNISLCRSHNLLLSKWTDAFIAIVRPRGQLILQLFKYLNNVGDGRLDCW